MQTKNQISMKRKTLYGIMLLGVFLSAFGAGNFPTARAQEETPQTPTPTSEPPACFTLDLIVASGEGTLTATTTQNCDGGYLDGTLVDLLAKPAEGYLLSQWSETDEDGDELVNHIIVTGNTRISVSFEPMEMENLNSPDLAPITIESISNPYLVKDIHSGTSSSYPYYFTEVNGVMYFEAYDELNGNELWKSDGAEAGTTIVKDIYPGSIGANPNAFIKFDGKLIFGADDGTTGSELWESDGTESGTKLLKDINSSGSSDPYNFIEINESLFFVARDDLNGMELWKTDGIDAGTLLVKDINSGIGDSIVYDEYQWMVSMNGFLYFTATDGVDGAELWKSDGTEAGTTMVKNINASGDSNPSFLTVANGILFFSADDGINGLELWKSDGTEAGTILVKEINSDSLAKFINVNDTLFFMSGYNTYYSTTLWKSDGTEEGTVLVKSIESATDPSGRCLVNLNGELFFSGDDGVYGHELWKSDGTSNGTVLETV